MNTSFNHAVTAGIARVALLSLFFIVWISPARADIGQPSPAPEIQTQTPAPIREAMIVAPEYILQTPQGEITDDLAESAHYPEMTALPEEDVWQRIRNGLSMNDLDSPLIKRHEKWYASHPDYVLRMSERAKRYLFHITE